MIGIKKEETYISRESIQCLPPSFQVVEMHSKVFSFSPSLTSKVLFADRWLFSVKRVSNSYYRFHVSISQFSSCSSIYHILLSSTTILPLHSYPASLSISMVLLPSSFLVSFHFPTFQVVTSDSKQKCHHQHQE